MTQENLQPTAQLLDCLMEGIQRETDWWLEARKDEKRNGRANPVVPLHLDCLRSTVNLLWTYADGYYAPYGVNTYRYDYRGAFARMEIHVNRLLDELNHGPSWFARHSWRFEQCSIPEKIQQAVVDIAVAMLLPAYAIVAWNQPYRFRLSLRNVLMTSDDGYAEAARIYHEHGETLNRLMHPISDDEQIRSAQLASFYYASKTLSIEVLGWYINGTSQNSLMFSRIAGEELLRRARQPRAQVA